MGLWHLLTSVDFAVAQIITLGLLAVVGMTIRQLPDFAFRSAGDYATAMDAIHTRYDPVLGAAIVDVLERLSVFAMFRSIWFSAGLTILVISIVVCTLDRTPKLWRGVSEIRVAQPEPYFDPRLPDRAEMSGVSADGVRGVLRRHGFRVREATSDDGVRVPLRRPPPVHEDGDAPDPHRPGPVPARGGGHLTARRRAGTRGPRRRVPDGPADRHARPAAGEEPRLRGARLRVRPGVRLHDGPRGVPRRPGDRAQDDPGQRPALGRGVHVPPERVRAGASPAGPRRGRASRCGTPPCP